MRFGRKTKRAAVLGCGPAGLFATHALHENGWEVQVFSKRRRSEMFGAQYLHAPIPGLTDKQEPVEIEYRLTGSVDEYRFKVYGLDPVETSVEHLTRTHHAWDIRAAYLAAWDLYWPLITEMEVTSETLGVSTWGPEIGVVAVAPLDLSRFDVVLSSIPLKSLCYQKSHEFHSTSVWAIGDAPERGVYAPYRPQPNTVECNGTWDVGWYRASNVFGYTTMEWPGNRRPPLPGVAEVTKPTRTDCNCYRQGSPRFVPIGRYGQWRKGVLSHHAYTQAAQL